MVKLLLFVVLISPISCSAFARTQVMVGAYHFPPFVEGREGKPIGGAIVDLVKALNQLQSSYQFTLTKTTPEQRYTDFGGGRFDLLMFESISWGWDKNLVDSSESYLQGGELYIALRAKGRGQAFFDDFNKKTVIGIQGYHYGFAGFNSDPEYLRQNFNMNFTKSNLGTIKMVLAGNRGDIAVVTKSFLNQFLNKHPERRQQLLISNKLDQEYNHTIIVRKGIKPTVKELDGYLRDLRKTGALDQIWQKHAIR